MPQFQHYWHRSELAELPNDGNRYEVLDGELLVTPLAGVPHQGVASELAFRLGVYLRADRAGYLYAPAALPFGSNELQPDIAVFPTRPTGTTWDSAPPPILVVEILSPSTRQRDLGPKLAAYRERLGIPTVWLVDIDQATIHAAEGLEAPIRTVSDVLKWQPTGSADAFTLDIADMFRTARE